MISEMLLFYFIQSLKMVPTSACTFQVATKQKQKLKKKNQTLIYKEKNITKIITTTKMENNLNNECNIS